MWPSHAPLEYRLQTELSRRTIGRLKAGLPRSQVLAAGNLENLSGDELGSQQVDERIGDIVRLAGPFERIRAAERRELFLRHSRGGQDRAGCDGVDLNVRGKFLRKDVSERDQPRLRDSIGQMSDTGTQGAPIDDVDNV